MQTIIMILSAVLFAAAMLVVRGLERQNSRHQEMSDEEILFLLSRKLGTSEFRLFCLAADSWKVSRQKVEIDFKTYLLNERIPFYVRDFVRKLRQKMIEKGMLGAGRNNDLLQGPGSTFYVS